MTEARQPKTQAEKLACEVVDRVADSECFDWLLSAVDGAVRSSPQQHFCPVTAYAYLTVPVAELEGREFSLDQWGDAANAANLAYDAARLLVAAADNSNTDAWETPPDGNPQDVRDYMIQKLITERAR